MATQQAGEVWPEPAAKLAAQAINFAVFPETYPNNAPSPSCSIALL
jgi:hypothetical protein